MGILTKGKYTYGNKTYAEILAFTSSVAPNTGDTVFDTTYNKLRSWDGNNFIHTHQKSAVVQAGILDGAIMVVSSTTDNNINFQQGATDTEGIIGVVEYSKGGAAGTNVPMTYFGDVETTIIAGNTTIGEYLKNNTTSLGYADGVTTATTGVFGIMIGPAITGGGSGTRKSIFKPVTRF